MGRYTVEYINENSTATDITRFVQSLGPTNFYSDGRISTSALTLQADFGQFVTDSNGGTTPIIRQFDRIRITYTSIDNDSYSHIFEVINDLAQESRQAGTLLPLTLEGRERNLSLVPFSGFFDPPIGHDDMISRILSVYGGSKNSTTQPTMIDSTNELENYNPNFWDFQYVDNCLDAITSVVNNANLGVSQGGLGDRFAVTFNDVPGDLGIMQISIFSQGSANSANPYRTLTPSDIYEPVQRLARLKQPVTGTVVIARGRPGSGGMPKEGDIYKSRLEFYERTPPYNSSLAYPEGSYVSHGTQITNPELPIGQIYQASRDVPANTVPPNGTYWLVVPAYEYIGNSIQYSPFTQHKAALYKNECTNPTASFASDSDASPKMLDYNIFINDAETQRDFVFIRARTDVATSLTSQQRAYLYDRTGYYPGFRILVDTSNLGTGQGSFSPSLDAHGTGAGRDPNGKPYANNAVTWVDGKWYVIKEHEDFDQIVVRNEGLYEWNVDFASGSRYPASDDGNANRRYRRSSSGNPNGWRKLDGQFLANDCLHSPSSIANVAGLRTPIQKSSGFYTDNSAVRIVYEYGVTDDTATWHTVLDQIAGFIASASGFLGTFATNAATLAYSLFLTPQYRNAGWWITFTAPFPFNTNNSITEDVGELYGGGSLLELQNHPYFDAYNQRVALSGKAGWNEEDSEDLMEITGVKFQFRLDITANDVSIPFQGDIPVAYWVMDDNGTIWKATDKYRFKGDIQNFEFAFGDFTPVYRARSPFGISNIVTNILVPELEIREKLNPARIRMQGFQLELAYDDKGRYMPNLLDNIIKPTISNLFSPSLSGNSVKFIGDIDSIQWVKTPIAIEDGSGLGVNPGRTIFPDIKDYPNISNIEQLRRAASAEFVTEYFQYEQYEILQNDRADYSLQDTVFLRDENLVAENDQTIAKTNLWTSGRSYVPNDIVSRGPIIFSCISPHTSSSASQPPNSAYWKIEGSTAVPNTRELTVGEIEISVTNSNDWQRKMTLIRRIPRS